MFRIQSWAVIGLILVPTGACAHQSTPQSTPVVEAVEPLRPGDLVRLRIWREPDLSGEFPVDEGGNLVLPKIGPVPVGATSPDSLKQRILTSYRSYLRNPSIEVVPLR